MMGRLTRYWPIAIMLIGISLIVIGCQIPVWTDFDVAMQQYRLADSDGQCGSERWYADMNALRTMRYPYIYTGCAILIALGTWAGLSFDRKAQRFRFANMMSPSSRIAFFALGTIAVIGSFFAMSLSLDLDLRHYEFPHCADTIAIPLYAIFYSHLIGYFLAILIGGLLMLGFGKLPVNLLHWNSSRPILSWSLTVIFGVAASLIGLLAILSAPSSSFAFAGPAVISVYILLSTRSALLSEKEKPNAKPSA